MFSLYCIFMNHVMEMNFNGVIEHVKNKNNKSQYTVYNAISSQTDSNPLETADQSIIDLKQLQRGDLRWIAISRDLKSQLSFGDTIIVSKCEEKFTEKDYRGNNYYLGEWVVRDVMNKRFKNKIDFLVPSNIIYGGGIISWSKKIIQIK